MAKFAPKGTYDDASLILRLYDMRREERMREARAWFATSFQPATLEELQKLCPAGSKEFASYRQVTTYWDMAASFVTGGVLTPELFYQSGRELLLVYRRLEKILPLVREANKDPFAFHNLETVAKDFIEYLDKRAPGTYAAFAERMTLKK